MARSRVTPKSKQPTSGIVAQTLLPDKDADWGGFVNIPVSEQDKEKFNAWFTENEAVLVDALSDLIFAGLKFSCVFDADNDCFIATLTGKGSPGLPLRMAMSARAGDYVTGVGLLLYKHFILADSDWGQFTPKGEKRKWTFG